MRTILLVTYDISPYRGSEASVSWNYVANMQHTNRLIVLYGKGKDEIELYLRTNTMPHVRFQNIAYTEITGHGFIDDIKYNLNYRKWHKRAATAAAKLLAQENVDIIHFLNPIGFKEPGFLWKLPRPYVWGPMQGVENRPAALFKALSPKGKINAIVRLVIHNAMFVFSPRVRRAVSQSDFIFAATPNTKRNLQKYYQTESIYLPENGITSMLARTPVSKSNSEPLRLIWAGELCERKALIILLDALKTIRRTNWELHVAGAGRLRSKMEETAQNYGIASRIVWHGKIPRTQVQEIFAHSHLHIITSLGEATTTVLWEAMANGVPTLSLDHCGMSGVICEKCGIKIPIHTYEQVTMAIAAEIESCIMNPERIAILSEGVLKCSEKFMWSNRIACFNRIYGQISQKA
ncbi:glycosyltransferase family 4 protein [Alistipes finegoldii]|jgi:hypothetical protein|uniref:glycosyltransferase family 4 protein n=1 Tax=Bacteria TaxID=2 RepID=UPI0015BF3EBB|nr:glycosyltransferase family 4 protein [Alistipes finegoldii]HJG74163.1 glycosyltransferase family 4 protein [Alistipes finegoldii]